MQKVQNIGVFFGSRSPEHDVSIITGQLVISTLKKLGYNVIPVYISKAGEWFIHESLGSLKFFTDNPEYSTKVGDLIKDRYSIDLTKSQNKLVFKKQGGILGSEIIVDLAFPAFHGSYGEDGTIQGLFEMFNVPYVGCDTTSSAIAMDKVLTKLMVKSEGIPTPDFVYFTSADWKLDKDLLLQIVQDKVGFPCFIKPPRLGSSIGIKKVNNLDELQDGIEVALFYDSKVLIEKGVQNLKDVTCCVIGNDRPKHSVLQESKFEQDLFDFDAKYIKDGGAQVGNAKNSLVIPADLDKATTADIQSTALKVYKLLGCSGISRIDFLYDTETKQYFVSEVNPLPGTLYNHLWKASGLEIEQLVEDLVAYALEKYDSKKQITYTFESEIIKSLKGSKLGNSAKLSSES